jgi:hypothetical protein
METSSDFVAPALQELHVKVGSNVVHESGDLMEEAVLIR